MADSSVREKKQLHLSHQTQIATEELDEISGAAFINGNLWVINDGDNGNTIFRIDSMGNILQKVTITNAVNHDWEELAFYNNNLYIGDFGNNNGSRKKLSIYKLNVDQLDENATEAQATEICFSSNEQSTYNTQLDFNFEAMIPIDGKIHLFTKNKSGSTSHYLLNDDIDFQFITVQEVIPVNFEVTAASYDHNRIFIAGYNLSDLNINYLQMEFNGEALVPAGNHTAGSVAVLGQVESLIVKDSKILMISEKISRGFLQFPALISQLEYNSR